MSQDQSAEQKYTAYIDREEEQSFVLSVLLLQYFHDFSKQDAHHSGASKARHNTKTVLT